MIQSPLTSSAQQKVIHILYMALIYVLKNLLYSPAGGYLYFKCAHSNSNYIDTKQDIHLKDVIFARENSKKFQLYSRILCSTSQCLPKN